MPQGGAAGQPWETGGQADAPGQQWQGGVPGQGDAPGQAGVHAQDGIPTQGTGPSQWADGPRGQQYGSPPQGPAGQPADEPMQGRILSPVNETETRVTGRRIVQYIIDAIIFGIIASVVSWALDRGTGGVHALLVLVTVLLVIGWYLLYWALRPQLRSGQTIGMQLMGIRVISKDGGPASFVQLAVRSILLVLFSPLSLLVGIIVMMLSRYRQRTGDHMAGTLVVRGQVQPMAARREYADAGWSSAR